MKNFDSFSYIYPPRPATKVPSTGLNTYENMGFIAQPKLNGSCGVLSTNGIEVKLMNRHKSSFARELINKDHLRQLHRGSGWTVLVGEFMNKSKRDRKGNLFNGVFVIFDILVYNGKHLVGSTFIERQAILDKEYPSRDYDGFISSVSQNVYRVNNFVSDFGSKWNDIIKTDMYEGWVMKRPSGKLEKGIRENNNTGWQLKCRKPTKNYQY